MRNLLVRALLLGTLSSLDPAFAAETCVPAADDTPDAGYVDTNCDGIDGNIAKSYFVAPSGADANPGTMAQPFATIARAIAAAAADPTRKHILISAGNYVESVSLVNGVSLFGQYEAATWTRRPTNVTSIVSLSATAITVTNYTATGHIEGLRIVAANASGAGASSRALALQNISGTLSIRYNVIAAGAGADGTAGPAGSNGMPGGPGGNGQPGCEESGGFCSSCLRPQGGQGGSSLAAKTGGAGGQPGHGSSGGLAGIAAPGGGGAGGAGAVGESANGQAGQAGGAGFNGAIGTGGAAFGSISLGAYVPANGTSGGQGAPGFGGGGGGGGGGGTVDCDSYGSAGGGGGGGGAGGAGGAGGTGGGGSFGILMQSASGAVVGWNTITAGVGGNGGAGGAGGIGGAGGSGGVSVYGGSSEQDDGGDGGFGGAGGPGGDGGGGGGGGGGPSYGVYGTGGDVQLTGNTISAAPGGLGGAATGAPSGARGASGATNILAAVPAVPTPPHHLAASPGMQGASIAFETPASDGGSAIVDYTASCQAGAVMATAAASPIALTNLGSGTEYTCTVTARNAFGASAPSAQVVFTTAAPPNPARLVNISTRMQVLTGNDVMIGGFVLGGSANKTVVVRARGPSLVPFGIANALGNPQLQLVRSSDQATLATNDDWGSASNAAAITASGFAPSNSLEAAILVNLPPGAYTAVVSGVGNTTGVAIVEVFESDHPEIPLANISTRGRVLTGNDVMIGGFVIEGSSPRTVVIRARGPSLTPFGITDALANPVLQLVRSSDQATLATNDDWQSASNAADVIASGFEPSNSLEAAILITLPPGAYTAIVTGANGGTGVGIVEVFVQ